METLIIVALFVLVAIATWFLTRHKLRSQKEDRDREIRVAKAYSKQMKEEAERRHKAHVEMIRHVVREELQKVLIDDAITISLTDEDIQASKQEVGNRNK